MSHTDLFKRLGYPKHSDKVYQVLRKITEAQSVSDIARQIKVSRMTVYRCLEALLADEMVQTKRVGKRLLYTVGSPQKLSKRIRMVEQDDTLLVAQLQEGQKHHLPPGIQFLTGAAGVQAAFDDVINYSQKGETFFRYTSEINLTEVNQYLAHDYRLRRDKKKLERLVISNAVSGNQKRSRLERFIKFIPAEASQFEQNIIQLVYGKRVSIIDLEKEEVMIIENERLAEFQKVIFRLLYKQL